MRCPNCGVEDTKVVDSRPFEDGRCIRRRRVCPNCGNKFFTYETAESTPLMVVKKDKSRQVFSREKLMNGVLKSCHKRPVSSAQIETLVRDVENTIKATGKKEVPSGEIGRLVMERLKEYAKDRLVLVITHDTSIISDADMIVKIWDGSISEVSVKGA